MKRILFITLAISVILGSCSGIDNFERPEQLTQADFVKDWHVFEEALTSFHPGLDAYHSSAEIDNFLADQSGKITTAMNYNEFYALLWETIDYFGDGHTAVIHPEWYYQQESSGIFPLELTVIDGELYLLDEDGPIPAGSRIIAIDDLPAQKILDYLDIYTASDGKPAPNETELLNFGFSDIYTDHFGSKKEYKVSWKAPGETDTRAPILQAWLKKKKIIAEDYEVEPLTSYEYYNIDSRNAYLGIHTFEIAEDEGYTGSPEEYEIFLKETFKELKNAGTNNLILDLRQNGGGDPILMAQLLSYLVPEPLSPEARMFSVTREVPLKDKILPSLKDKAMDVETELRELTQKDSDGLYSYITQADDEQIRVIPDEDLLFTGGLKVLISPVTFSAGSMCAAIIKDRTDAIIIGQETCGSMKRLCAAADFDYRLPNTGIQVSIPTVGIYVNLKNNDYEEGRGVIPDVIVENRAELIIRGADPEMQTALRI